MRRPVSGNDSDSGMSTKIQDAKVDFLTPYKASCLDRYLDVYLSLPICRPTPLTSTATFEYVGLTTLNPSSIMPTMRVCALQTYHRPPWLRTKPLNATKSRLTASSHREKEEKEIDHCTYVGSGRQSPDSYGVGWEQRTIRRYGARNRCNGNAVGVLPLQKVLEPLGSGGASYIYNVGCTLYGRLRDHT